MKLQLSNMVHGACVVAIALGSSSCGDLDTFVPFPEAGGPAGVITGSVTYSGPMPCTQNGFVLGGAVLLGFEENLLPPPEGLGTFPAALNVITGDVLFSGIRHQLTFNEDGSRWCPAPNATDVTVTGEYTMSPLAAGVYEIRGFYDLDGDFNPGFSIFNLPSAGDVGGGAINNAIEALQGAPVQYRRIGIGTLQEDGSRIMPPEGFRVDGVAVSFGLPLPLERPIFHAAEVRDDTYGNTDPSAVTIPSDYQLSTFPLDEAFVRFVLRAGVAPADQTLAEQNPFFFPSDPALLLNRQDVNGDGVIDNVNDGIPESSGGVFVPALLPLAILTKLQSGNDLQSQESPSIILQGITLDNDLITTLGAPTDLAELRNEITISLRPAVLCIDTNDQSIDGVLLNTHPTDMMGNVLVADEPALEATLSEQFLRPITIQYGCLPQGRYALNLVYDTGQAWTVPNEAGICLPGEPANSDNSMCGVRARLASQSVVVTIGPPTDEQYCLDNPTPAACLPAAQ